jgi:Holliday junction resolvase RusA-like endonuclease
MPDLFPIRFTILGPPCSYKNSKRVVTKPFIKALPSEKAEAWMESAVFQLRGQWRYKPIPKTMPINAAIVSYLPHERFNDDGEPHGWTIDLDNTLGGPGDAMQSAGILEDDVCIESYDGSRRRYDPKRPRVEITLTLLDEQEDQE